jgi:diguanylate cyclase (GGDEF)-like protein
VLTSLKYVCLSLLVVAFFAITRNDLTDIRGLSTDTTFDTTQLAELTRLEKEMLQFRVHAATIYRGERETTREAMQLAFDILWSRVNTEYNRFINPKFDSLRNYRATLGELAGDLRRIDVTVQNLQPGDEKAWQEIEATMERTAPRIAVMTNDSYTELYSRATNTAEIQRKALRSLDHILQVFLAAMMAGLIMLFWQLRNGERLNKALTEREAEIMRLATLDPLTGLKNRRYFDERMRAIDEGKWIGNLHVLLVDLDGFKHVNDTHGHAAGDFILKTVAQRFPVALGHSALLARLGGDEFAVVVDGSRHEAYNQAVDIIREVSQPVLHGGTILKVGASIGISTFKPVPLPTSMMLREADAALYEAKGRGRGVAVHFSDLRNRPDTTITLDTKVPLAVSFQ